MSVSIKKRLKRISKWINRALNEAEEGDTYKALDELEVAHAELSSLRKEIWDSILSAKKLQFKRRIKRLLFVVVVSAFLFYPVCLFEASYFKIMDSSKIVLGSLLKFGTHIEAKMSDLSIDFSSLADNKHKDRMTMLATASVYKIKLKKAASIKAVNYEIPKNKEKGFKNVVERGYNKQDNYDILSLVRKARRILTEAKREIVFESERKR